MAWAPRARTSTTTSPPGTATGDVAETIQDLYLDKKKDEAAALIPDELLELTNLVGSEGFIQERVAAFRESGVTTLNVTPLGDAPALIEQVKGWAS